MNKKLTRFEPIVMIAVMWVVYIVTLLTPFTFLSLGIGPRTLTGLLGIVTAPFIHIGLYHLLSNSIPFVVLGMLVRIDGRSVFWNVTIIIAVVGGLIPWLLSGADSIVGASGLVFGYWAYLLFNGIYTRSLKSIIIAVVVFVIYGTMAFTLFRYYPGVSFMGHLGGAFGGFVAAYLLGRHQDKNVSEQN